MFRNKRVMIYGRHLNDLKLILPSDINLVDKDPDLIISYGGDGFLLGAERDYPNVPKFPLRDFKLNPKCDLHSETKVLQMALNNELWSEKFIKLEAEDSKGNKITAVNDIVLHNKDPRSAIRYRVWINGKPFIRQIVGDGLVIATPFGSTAYYKSITGSTFNVGVGVAFNNSTEQMDHLVLDDDLELEVMITRGPAILLGDNSPQEFTIEAGEKVTIRKSSKPAIFYGLDIFRCSDCYELRKKFWTNNWE